MMASRRRSLAIASGRDGWQSFHLSFSTAADSSLSPDSLASSGAPRRLTQLHDKYPTLFQPLELSRNNGGSVILPNRVLMGSMHTGLEPHSIPSLLQFVLKQAAGAKQAKHPPGHDDMAHRMATYFARRAQGGVGLMVTGGIAPNRAGWVGMFASQLTNESEMKVHQQVTKAVHAVNVPIVGGRDNDDAYYPASVAGKICLQILHTGRYGYHPFVVSASATKSPISPFGARALTPTQVESTAQDFVRTAVLAKQAGYDGVEIMASEGYLLSQFLSPRTNLRTDVYGSSRARLPLDIVRQIREAIGQDDSDFIIIFRLSLADLVDKGALTLDDAAEIALQLQEAGISILNTGIGWHESRVPTIHTSVPRGAYAFPSLALKYKLRDQLYVPIVATNRINHPQTAEHILTNHNNLYYKNESGDVGGVDLISMARPFLADPDLMLKSRLHQEDFINTCIGCNQACLDHAFVGKTASCLVNPAAGHETLLDFSPLPLEKRQNIGVIGAGPAGCAFAIAAAEKGHTVTLYESAPVLGGQFNYAAQIPGKEEFYETIRYFSKMLEKLNVSVKLNTEITSHDIDSGHHDSWIVATGVYPRDPKIPGQDHPNVLSYLDVLKHHKPVGKRVAIIGAGGIGFDVAEYLLHSSTDSPANLTDPAYSISRAQGLETLQMHRRHEFWQEWGLDYTMKDSGGGLTAAPPVIPAASRQLYLLQRKRGKLGANLGKTTGWIHRTVLARSGAVTNVDNVTYDRIDERGHLHITRKGNPKKGTADEHKVLEVDNIVICAGQIEADGLARGSNPARQNVFTIGGAEQAGELDAKRAIDMAVRLALRIHEKDVVPGNHVFSGSDEPHMEETLFKWLRRFIG
jgi:2,4-dienoyl-CoA reductase (NADPH2)